MKLHGNARLSVKGRELLVDRVENAGWSLTEAAEAAGVSDRTARKWLVRYRIEGSVGLLDRSSAPALVANRTDERRVEVIAALRRLRMTGAEIARVLDVVIGGLMAMATYVLSPGPSSLDLGPALACALHCQRGAPDDLHRRLSGRGGDTWRRSARTA